MINNIIKLSSRIKESIKTIIKIQVMPTDRAYFLDQT